MFRFGLFWFGLWCLTPLQQYFGYIMAVSFLGYNNNKNNKAVRPAICEDRHFTLKWKVYA